MLGSAGWLGGWIQLPHLFVVEELRFESREAAAETWSVNAVITSPALSRVRPVRSAMAAASSGLRIGYSFFAVLLFSLVLAGITPTRVAPIFYSGSRPVVQMIGRWRSV